VIDYEMFGILLLDEDRDELVLRKAVNFGPAKERSRIAVTEGLCGAAVRSREPVLVGDVRKDPRYVKPHRLLRGLESHAGLPAPELGERLLSDFEGFLGDASPADDVTLIVVKVL
jgi:GAF domain-containing protein